MNTSQQLPATMGRGAYPTINVPPPDKELTLKDLWSIFARRRMIVIGTVFCCLAVAVLICTFSTRRYQATGELQVQKESADALGLESMMGAAGGATDALDANITMQTQAQVLQSDSLALKVIKDLNLEQNQDFRPSFSPVGWALGMLSPSGSSDSANATLEDAPGRRTRLVAIFKKNLKVKPVSGTRLIDVTYLNPDPKMAAAITNHLVQELVNYNFQTRYNATEQAAIQPRINKGT